MTTGLYDENFFNNPARATANPESKFTIFQLTPFEVNSATVQTASSLMGGANAQNTLLNDTGSNLHDRTQLILPAYYLAANKEKGRRYALAFALISSIQMDADVRNSFQANGDAIVDIGPAVTYARKFLSDDSLSVGITGHYTYRAGAILNYGLLQYVEGTSFSSGANSGDGAMFNFDIGSTYRAGKVGQYEISVGGAIQNTLGGTYSNSNLSLLKLGNNPPPQPRSYGLGVSALRHSWWKLHDTIFALEATDILNNSNGSIFRLLHLGGETRWKSIAVRLGLNQGYWAAGLGLDVHYFNLDLATYGEEMGLNAGTMEDRRYTLNLGVHI